MEKERKNLFFIKLPNNFFESDDIYSIEELMLEKEVNPSYRYLIITLYQKLILKSLEKKGLVLFEQNVTPQLIKKELRFRSGLGIAEDIKIINSAIELFEELKLITLENNLIFVPKAKKFTSTSEEEAIEKITSGIKIDAIISSIKNKTLMNKDVPADEKEEIIYQERLINEFLPTLAAFKFSPIKEVENYIPAFDDLFYFNVTCDEISKSLNIFIKQADPNRFRTEVTDKVDYLKKALWNNLRQYVRAGLEVYDLLITILSSAFPFIKENSDKLKITNMLNEFVNSGIDIHEVNKAAKNIIEYGKIKINESDDLYSFINMYRYQLKEWFKNQVN